MGDMNQFKFVKSNAHRVKEPILEVGSKNYGNTPDYRSLFPDFEYIGVDMEEGGGVDAVLDLTDEFEIIDAKLNGKRFKTVICASVLEHCANPFKMCNNLTRLLDDNGIVFIGVPFSWRIHGYPSDYWRFTPDGVEMLFPEMEFDINDGNLSTSTIGETAPIDEYMFSVLNIDKGLKKKIYCYSMLILIRAFRKIRILPQIFDYPYVFPPVMVNMIGEKIPKNKLRL